MIIDVHAHYFPQAFTEFAEPHGLNRHQYVPAGGKAPDPMRMQPENLERRLSMMDEAGVERQILSNIFAPYTLDSEVATAGARLVNDLYARLCTERPDRFSFWASLPLPHVEAAIAETRRAMDDLGALGVTIQTFCLNESIAQARFDALYAELNARKAVVFIHPCQNALCSSLVGDHGLTVCAGASMEDAVAAMHLIVARIPERFPDIRFIIPHFGGILPMLLNRLDGQLPKNGAVEPPSATARRFYYDTVGWGSAAALAAAITAFGAEKLVPGSDWPILLGWESYKTTFDHIRHSGLPEPDIDQILERNVPGLVGDRIQRQRLRAQGGA